MAESINKREVHLMARKLDGKRVAILVADGFEQVEMTKPREALDESGAETKIVSLKPGKIQGMNHADKGDTFDVDLAAKDARSNDFDALMIPGGCSIRMRSVQIKTRLSLRGIFSGSTNRWRSYVMDRRS